MSRGFHLFSDYFARRDNVLQRLDVRLKMGVAIALFAAILCSTRPVLPVSAWLLSIATMIALRIPRKIIFHRFLPSLGIVIVIMVLQALLIGKTPVFSVSLGDWVLTATREGIAQGTLTGSRVLGAVGTLLLLSSVTPAHEIFHTLHWCHMPKVWVEIAMLVYRYIFVLLDEATDMAAAQRVRLGYSSFRNSMSSTSGLIGAVIVRSMEQSFRTHEAMIARGYAGEYRFGGMDRLSWKTCFDIFSAGVGIAFVFLLIEGQLW
ncbi:MAG: cobalt ECF transporter T component CbiQ [Desulfobacterales bacterium]|jgi:cobalt/nickel transport system permease protein|nr:cobalt ECF transporter T component CbiQ [Desulfobacter sp.]MDP6683258.1 cobalt ECF transporter T component CbiQ [Desulfobacterales bacterium]MDP6808621.1 cobalt ECF transporter T component CbiQ [Desulfobacterales bacterium]|tara:strand:- start:7601 stop:8386 length:786 start_codon:yes stop_codon:yes gene_type:complete